MNNQQEKIGQSLVEILQDKKEIRMTILINMLQNKLNIYISEHTMLSVTDNLFKKNGIIIGEDKGHLCIVKK